MYKRQNENVSTEVLCKICDALACEVDDIIDFVPDGDKPGAVSYTHLDVYKRQTLLWIG